MGKVRSSDGRVQAVMLKGYELLRDIRLSGMRPSHVVVYLYPVKIFSPMPGFYDNHLCTQNEISELAEYDLDALRGLTVCIYGRRKDDRLRNATKAMLKLTDFIVVASDEHTMANIYQNGVWK